MDLLKLVNEYWSILITIVGLIVWLVRLEGKGDEFKKTNEINQKYIERVEKQVDALEIKHQQLDSKLVQQLADVRESLARIEGALAIKNKQ